MTTLHSVLGASSAHRWLECPGSVRESEGMPNESSIYAREGSAAHWVAAKCLEENTDALKLKGVRVPEYPEIDVTEEMCDAVQQYLDAIRETIDGYLYDDYELDVEVKFDLSHIFPDMFGTCDAVLYFPAVKRLVVFDYKHGWKAVAAERNKQTMYYGLGALTGKHNRPIESIQLVIVQPRANRNTPAVKRWECDPLELLDFRADLIEGAKRTQAQDAPLKPGEWCKFCPAAPKCKALVRFVEEKAMAEFAIDDTLKPKAQELMTPGELKLAWENAGIIEAWAKNVKAFAHAQALVGRPPQGMKLVHGRGIRNWRSETEALARLQKLDAAGYLEGDIYTEPELKSPAQIEAILGKEKKRIENLWIKAAGGLVLVPESDDRPAAKVDADKEFSAVDALL